MNILQINTTDIRGGAAQVTYGLKEGLEKLGHQTSMFVGQKDSQDENVFVLNDKKSFGQRIRKRLSYYLANDIDPFSSDKIIKTEQFKKADIVHCHNLHGYYFNLNTLKKISRLKPVVWTFHDMWPITAHCAHTFDCGVKNGFFQCPSLDIPIPIKWRNEKYLENKKREIYEHSKFHIVVPSLWLKQKVEKSLLKDKPITLIYNGIDTDIFKSFPKDEARQELNLPLDKKIVLSVIKKGQSNPWKGADYVKQIIDKWRENKNVIFACVGGGDYDFPNVINIPFIRDAQELAKYYSAADMLLYPSIADNCPLVVLEARACGLPVVSFETGGIPELVEHEKTGYIAKYRDVDDLNYNLNRLIEADNQRVEEIRKKSIDRVRQMFTLNLMVDKYLQLYNQVLNSI